MPDSGEDLGVHLYDLYVAGTKYLPEVAKQFIDANSGLQSAASGDGAWLRPGLFGGGMGPAYESVAGLREQLSAITGQTADNLNAVAAALVLAARRYQEGDEDARRKFQSLQRGAGHGEY